MAMRIKFVARACFFLRNNVFVVNQGYNNGGGSFNGGTFMGGGNQGGSWGQMSGADW